VSPPEAPVLIEHPEEHVGLIRLNRPERLNAVSPALYEALLSAVQGFSESPAIRVMVITGQGRAFCVGADLKAHKGAPLSAEERGAYVSLAQRANRALQIAPKPVIAAINGHAIGAGIELALSCDFLIAAADAKVGFPEVTLGTLIGGGVSYTLAQRVGLARARELILLGEKLTGQRAAELGVVSRAVPGDRVLPESLDLARRLAANAPVSMGHAKALLRGAAQVDVGAALDAEAAALLDCMGTRDWQEGVDAFAEKRAPRFLGE
jgi:enoyl-CoA hydratase